MAASLKLHGIGVSRGFAVGTALVLAHRKVLFAKRKLSALEVSVEVARLHTARERAKSQLRELGGRLGREQHNALIVEAHQLMLDDPFFLEEVTKLIENDHLNAEWAVRRVAKHIRHQFDDLEDTYFRERRADVDYVADRLVRNLVGEVDDEPAEVPEGSVIVARDIPPADAALLVQSGKVLALVTDAGGQTSHTAIVARARAIPAVIGLSRGTELIRSGDRIALDGEQGIVWVRPSEAELKPIYARIQSDAKVRQGAMAFTHVEAVTPDGVKVGVLGNIEFPDEIDPLIEAGAEGIGLYRTEFLFVNRTEPPREEDHYLAYKDVLQRMHGKPVTIRTMDLGGDKVRGRRHEKEANPAMGLRAIRYCLSHRELFRVQLRAILRASVHGPMQVMFPLVSGLSELREARSELEYCRSELSRQGVPIGNRFPVGIMVETPSAAWMADRLAQEVDFFSIGTNDLIQYTLAIDRHNRDVAYLYQPLHLAVLRTLQHIVAAARNANIPVSMCGEMAGDPSLTVVLIALGFDSLSTTAGQIPWVKAAVRQWSKREAQDLLRESMSYSSPEEIERFVRTRVNERQRTLLEGMTPHPTPWSIARNIPQ